MAKPNGRSLFDRVRAWPVTRQVTDLIKSSRPLVHAIAEMGMGEECVSARTRQIQPRTREATVTPSVCPYCAVGCSTLIYSQGDHVIDIEGNADSPTTAGTLGRTGAATHHPTVNPDRVPPALPLAPHRPSTASTLCPKAAPTYQPTSTPDRVPTVLYRAPCSTRWEYRPLAWALARIAERIKETRDQGFVRQRDDGTVINQTINLAILGGATLDNEENYLIKKLFTGGLGVVWLENQARI